MILGLIWRLILAAQIVALGKQGELPLWPPLSCSLSLKVVCACQWKLWEVMSAKSTWPPSRPCWTGSAIGLRPIPA
jgi:hypothetical protein